MSRQSSRDNELYLCHSSTVPLTTYERATGFLSALQKGRAIRRCGAFPQVLGLRLRIRGDRITLVGTGQVGCGRNDCGARFVARVSHYRRYSPGGRGGTIRKLRLALNAPLKPVELL